LIRGYDRDTTAKHVQHKELEAVYEEEKEELAVLQEYFETVTHTHTHTHTHTNTHTHTHTHTHRWIWRFSGSAMSSWHLQRPATRS
jgi:carbohydrate-binding DOMON domain-containing protein